jgi:UDP-N-acetylglucosamine:LPS N-acetylglucosamine transferase
MKTILFGWELGANFGHVGPLRELAREFRRQGYRPVFALRDVVGTRALLATDEFPVLQAPIWPRPGRLHGRPFASTSYGDILALHGFAQAEPLLAIVQAWDRLIDLVKPDLVVAEFSPTLCLAAFGTLPTAAMGTGYTMPPVHGVRFPQFLPDRPPLIGESVVLDAVQQVQAQRGRPVPRTLPALLDTPLRIVTSFAELDPYRSVRREPVLGPLEPLPGLQPPPWEPRLFAYLGDDHPALETIVECLAELKAPAEVYLRGDVGVLRRVLSARGVVVHREPPPLQTVVTQAAVIMSQAGSATAHMALCAGRPQLLFPTHQESELTTQALESLGVGVRVPSNASKAEITASLDRVLSDPVLTAKAASVAETFAARAARDSLGVAIAACLKILA